MAGKTAQVVPSAARTATGSLVVPGDFSDEDELVLHIYVTAASGTSPSMTVSIQDSLDGGSTWSGISTTSALTAASTTSLRVGTNVAFGPALRVSWTITGTTPSFTFSVRMFAK